MLFHFEKKIIYILTLNGPHNINNSQLSLSPHYIPGSVLSTFTWIISDNTHNTSMRYEL